MMRNREPGPQTGRLRSPLKTPCEKLEAPLNTAVTVRSFVCTVASVHDTDVAVMENEHDIALFVLAELAWYHRQACSKHASS